ncbi:hypothetical protein [Salibacter sp.]|uniref:hypothetical protein n=1 Tax=Salibacter sp. TaxID=2010995 RepID=UPI002870110C|nr:hypothetical protein [Salibacter sp.]MDR9487568.1 hypothetical protein [Salibacter sp.]
MKVVVNDANILIDVVKLQIESYFFELEFDFYTTDLVFEELNANQVTRLKSFIEANKLYVESLEPVDLIELYDLRKGVSGLSDNDLSAFLLSKNKDGVLITSDLQLRKFAKEKKVSVHGHLWVFDQLVETGILHPELACEKLNELINEINKKLGLPKTECEKRLKYWMGLY